MLPLTFHVNLMLPCEISLNKKKTTDIIKDTADSTCVDQQLLKID